MTATVLLTGATGFVGRHVLQSLGSDGVRVRAVVRGGDKTPLTQGEFIDAVIPTPNLFAENAEWWADTCSGIDTVIHIAWYVEPGRYHQSVRNLDCLSGTLQLAKGAVQAKVRRFIGIGTCFEYDLSGGLLSVETPLRPLTLYATSKVAAFMVLSKWLPACEVEFAWCRLFYLYGQGEDPRRLVPYVRAKLAAGEPAELTSGSHIRDFLDVKDAGNMIAKVATGDRQGPINICSGIPISVRQLAERIADEYGRRDLLRFGARPENPFDPPYVVGVGEVKDP